jgi:hypothetical protein
LSLLFIQMLISYMLTKTDVTFFFPSLLLISFTNYGFMF